MKKLLILLSFAGISLVSTTSSVIASTLVTNSDLTAEIIDVQKRKKKKNQVSKEKVKINTRVANKQYPGIIKRINNTLSSKGYATTINDKNKDKTLIKSLVDKKDTENDFLSFDFESDLNNKKTSLVMNSKNLYIEGFISNKKYFYFKDADIEEYFDKNSDNINLGYTGNYNELIGNKDLIMTKESIAQAISNLAKFANGTNPNLLQTDLVQIITITAESMRFFSVRNKVQEVLSNKDAKISWQKDIKPIVTNWQKWSKEYHSGKNKSNALGHISMLNKKEKN